MESLKPRQIKKQSTRNRLVDKAFSLFLARGFDGVTVDDIAQQAEVSRRTVFRYFSSKEAIVFPTHDEKLSLLSNCLEEAGQTHSMHASLRIALVKMAEYFESTKEHVQQQDQIISQSDALMRFAIQIDQDWAEVIAQFIHKHQPQQYDLFAARVIATALVGGIRVAYQQWIDEGCHDEAFKQASVKVFDILAVCKD